MFCPDSFFCFWMWFLVGGLCQETDEFLCMAVKSGYCSMCACMSGFQGVKTYRLERFLGTNASYDDVLC